MVLTRQGHGVVGIVWHRFGTESNLCTGTYFHVCALTALSCLERTFTISLQEIILHPLTEHFLANYLFFLPSSFLFPPFLGRGVLGAGGE
jgi:hypothetical protein